MGVIKYHLQFTNICFSVGAWGGKRHSESCHFLEESNGPGVVWLNVNFPCIAFTVTLEVHHLCTALSQYSGRQGFVPAMNALAWYYEHFEHDYKKAVQLWEQADLLECPEAPLNLGVIYSQGLYPGKAADEVS